MDTSACPALGLLFAQAPGPSSSYDNILIRVIVIGNIQRLPLPAMPVSGHNVIFCFLHPGWQWVGLVNTDASNTVRRETMHPPPSQTKTRERERERERERDQLRACYYPQCRLQCDHSLRRPQARCKPQCRLQCDRSLRRPQTRCKPQCRLQCDHSLRRPGATVQTAV